MKKIYLIFLLAYITFSCNQQQTTSEQEETTPVQNTELRAELMDILALDQDLRISLDTLDNMYDWDDTIVQQTWEQIHYNDSVNLIRIENIIEEFGWPGKTLVGEDAADIAFLVLQHCSDVEIMEKYLPTIKEAVKQEELEKQSLALYIDRIKMFRGEPQIYGTQLSYDNNTHKMNLYTVEDEANLNIRRAEMGLIPIEEYLEHFGLEYQKPE